MEKISSIKTSDNQQLAQSGTEIGIAANTNCSICRGKKSEKRDAINRALGKGISYRDIEAMTSVSYRTVGNHAQHLPAIFKEAKEKGILEQPVDVRKEFSQQLRLAKKLRAAAEEYLTDPETGELTLVPRSDEVLIVYNDFSDLTPKGEPKRKTDGLDVLLERAATGNVEPQRTIIKHVDIRSFALDAIRTADSTIDKFAKLAGEYQKERENSDLLEKVAASFNAWLEDHPETTDAERAVWVQRFARGGGVEVRVLSERVGIVIGETNLIH